MTQAQLIEREEIEFGVQVDPTRRTRPYSLKTFIEYVAGPMPTGSESGQLNYALRIQGLYNNYHLNARVVTLNGEGAAVIAFVDRPINRRWWIRKAHSGLTAVEADQLACSAGVHPSVIWSSWFDDALEELEQLTEQEWFRLEMAETRRLRHALAIQRATAA